MSRSGIRILVGGVTADGGSGAFQAQLDNFPDAVTFDVTGKIAFELSTPAYTAMVELGVSPRGWVLVTQPDGGEIAVPGGPNVIPEEDTE